jgi:nucleoside phosphorylase
MTNQRLKGDQRMSAPKRRKLDKDHECEQGSNWATASTRLSHDDYMVRWICALPLEMAAAKAMLDEIHPSLPNSLDYHNTYTLGQIGARNIVIACMPSGMYGTTSAVTVAASMRSSFRSIRVGLMIGIGGGAPSQHADIRLGDVVVSKPNENFRGVVQYDYGKTIQDAIFKRIGTLNKPPHVLLTAVSQLQADHRLRPSRIPEYLSEMAAKYPSMVPDFAYCDRRQDHLFEAQYEHSYSEDTCERCDPGRLVTRPPRPGYVPVIHDGLVASGNQVMEHGRTRDRWVGELVVLCFEMEAAGLMDHLSV